MEQLLTIFSGTCNLKFNFCGIVKQFIELKYNYVELVKQIMWILNFKWILLTHSVFMLVSRAFNMGIKI